MKAQAMLSVEPGGPETLRLCDIPMPEPGPGEVRVAVRAASVNFPDTLIIRDLYQIRPPRPFAPGGEIAGVVEAAGQGANGLKAGDRVLFGKFGGTDVKVDGEDLLILRETDILGVVEVKKKTKKSA